MPSQTTTTKDQRRGRNGAPSKLPAVRDTLDGRQLLTFLHAFKRGDFSARMPVDQTGIAGKIADALNEIVELNERTAGEIHRIGCVVGKDGRIAQRASIGNAIGGWADCI